MRLEISEQPSVLHYRGVEDDIQPGTVQAAWLILAGRPAEDIPQAAELLAEHLAEAMIVTMPDGFDPHLCRALCVGAVQRAVDLIEQSGFVCGHA